MPLLSELFDLSGRVAIVTGGSRGLGLQIAEALGEMGARIAIPFSPLRTKRPIVRQVWKPATRVAVGR